jgi:putative transposase
LFGIFDQGSRRMLTFRELRDRLSITVLRLLLNAIEHFIILKAIRTDNEAIFTSWIFRFALQWLGIHHQRMLPHCPWMNGRIERVWSTFKQVLRACRIPEEVINGQRVVKERLVEVKFWFLQLPKGSGVALWTTGNTSELLQTMKNRRRWF